MPAPPEEENEHKEAKDVCQRMEGFLLPECLCPMYAGTAPDIAQAWHYPK